MKNIQTNNELQLTRDFYTKLLANFASMVRDAKLADFIDSMCERLKSLPALGDFEDEEVKPLTRWNEVKLLATGDFATGFTRYTEQKLEEFIEAELDKEPEYLKMALWLICPTDRYGSADTEQGTFLEDWQGQGVVPAPQGSANNYSNLNFALDEIKERLIDRASEESQLIWNRLGIDRRGGDRKVEL